MFLLKDIALFSGLNDKQLDILQSQLHLKHYTKESIVFYEGDKSEYLYILLDGTVRLFKTSPKGSQVHIHNFSAPEIVALFATFEQVSFPASCEFLTEGTIGLLPLHTIYNSLDNKDFALSLITALSRRMKLLADLLHKETIFSSEAKIADIVLNNPSVFERLKNNEIASILNITPETLSRILTKLKRKNIISINAHVVTIHNQKELEHIIDTNKIQT